MLKKSTYYTTRAAVDFPPRNKLPLNKRLLVLPATFFVFLAKSIFPTATTFRLHWAMVTACGVSIGHLVNSN